MRLSYRLKLILAMASLIVLVAVSSLYFSSRAVESHYSVLLERQFADLSTKFLDDQKERLNRFAVTLAESTTNPRLTAAFEVGYLDDYDRFYYDLATELQPILQRAAAADQRYPPFFRFIDFEGNFLSPPSSLAGYLGIGTPIDESFLEARLTPFASNPEETAVSKAGYMTFPGQESDTLCEVWIVPTFVGTGLFMGDLIFVQTWDPESLQHRNIQVRSGLLVADRLYGNAWPNGALPEVETRLATEAERIRSGETDVVEIAGEEFAVYLADLPVFPGFEEVQQVTFFSLREEKMILHSIRQTLLSVSGVAMALGLTISLIIGSRLSRRIQSLVEGTRAIASGLFDRKIAVRGADEISDLGLAFNSMADDLALKEKYRSVLEKVTDASIAEQLTSGQIKLGGEEREVSILFCDIRQFTPLSRSATAAEIVELLNRHMTALTKVVHRHHGVVDKFVGDEIMVLFGAPKSFGNDAQLAVACALEMLEIRAAMNQQEKPAVEIGIGIATGKVVAGCMGSEDRLNYTVIGNCVNLASRLCGQAAAGTCLIDEKTASRLDNVPLLETEPIQLKGFTHRVPVYTIAVTEGIATP